MGGLQPTLGRQATSRQLESPRVESEPEAPETEPEAANSVVAALVEAGLDWPLDLFAPLLDLLDLPDFFDLPVLETEETEVEPEGTEADEPGAAAATGTAALTALAPAKGAPSPAEARPGGTGEGAAAADEAPEVLTPSAAAPGARPAEEPPTGPGAETVEAAAAGPAAKPTSMPGLPRAEAPSGGAGGAGGADEGPLGAWWAKVHRAVARVKRPKLTRGQGEAVTKAGHDAVGTQAQQTGRVPDEAKGSVPKPKLPADLPPFPDDETKASVAKIDPKLGRVLLPHTLPDLLTREGGHVPQIPLDVPPPTPSPESRPPARKTAPGEPGAKAPEDAGKAKKPDTAKAPVPAQGEPQAAKAPAAGTTVSAEAPEIPSGDDTVRTKADVGAVVARVLAEPDKQAQRVVDEAVRVAYNGKLAEAWPELRAMILPGERSYVEQELRRIAAAAGDTEEVLNQKVAAARTELSADGKAIEADLSASLAAARTGVAAADAMLSRTIADWHGIVDRQVRERAAATRSDVDVAKILADRDRLVAMVTTTAAQGVVAYDTAAKQLKATLTAEVDKQRRAYAEAARLDRGDIEKKCADIEAADRSKAAPYDVLPDYAAQARIDYRPAKYWLDERMEALRVFEATGVRKIDAETETFTSELNEAASQARDDIREWAARRLGYERNWFQRLLDMVADWMAQSQVQTAVWAKQRAAAAAAQVDKDLEFLETEANRLAKLSKDELHDELALLRADQQAIVLTFMKSGGEDALGAVAEAMIMRLSAQRRGDLLKAIDERVMGLEYADRQVLYRISAAESPALTEADRTARVDRLHDGFKGPGTKEGMVFDALTGLTAIGGKAVEFTYREVWDEDLKARLESELDDWLTWSSHDIDKARALLAGESTDAIAIDLDRAMHGTWNGLGIGTDEDAIFELLRNKTPDQIADIKKAYRARYGKDLELEVKGELHEGWIRGTHDEDRAEALFKSDTEMADVIAMDQAMHGGWLGLGLGTDRKTLENIYLTNDKELEREADANQWDAETLAKKRSGRRAALDDKYASRYKKTLTSQFVDEMSGAELDLVAGLREEKWNKVDAARIAQEHDSIFYADDKVINDAMQGQFKRTYADAKRDGNLLIEEAMAADRAKVEQAGSPEERKAAQRTFDEKWPPEYVVDLRQSVLSEARRVADKSAQDNFPKLEETYDSAYKGQRSFWSSSGRYEGLQTDVSKDTQLTQHDKAMALIKGRGTLTEVQEIDFAIRGAGTDTDIARETFKGKRKKDMDTLAGDWETEHPHEGSFQDFVLGDFSGREYQEMNEQVVYGEAVTPREKADRGKRLLEFENSTWLDWGSSREIQVMKGRYDRLEREAQEYEEFEKKKGQPEYDWTKHAELWGKVDASAQMFDSAVTSHRASVDVISDTVAQVVGAIVTVIVVVASIAADIVTVGTAVTATPGVIAFLGGMWGAIAVGAVGLGLTMLAKQALTGKAYGWEAIGTDLIIGAIDIATSALTAGLGGKMLKGSKSLITLFGKGRVGRILAKGIVSGAEGMVQAAPGAVAGQLLDPENFRKGDNAILNVISGAAFQVGMAGVMSAGTGMLHAAVQTDLVRVRTDAAYQNEIFERFQAKNPGKTREDFMQGLDKAIMRHSDLGFDDPRLQKAMRAKLLEHIPSAQHGRYADVPIEIMPAEQFHGFSRSGSGNAVTVIRNGEPVVIMRSGVSMTELTFEGPHLQQIRDPKNAPRIALLEEHRMERWDLLTFDEQVEAYRTKVDLEIEAHEQVLRSLEAQKGSAVDPAEWAQARTKAQENLDNLRVQKEKVNSITPEERATAMAKPSETPDYLQQPARLFSKDPRQRLAAEHGPAAPVAVDEQRREVGRLRKEIAGLEGRLDERGRLNQSEMNNLQGKRVQLDAHYRMLPGEQPHEAHARLFDPLPDESLADYHKRLEGLSGEVERGVKVTGEASLREAYMAQRTAVGEDLLDVEARLLYLGDVDVELRANGEKWLQTKEKLKAARNSRTANRPSLDEIPKLEQALAEHEATSARLHKDKDELVQAIRQRTERPSLFFGDRPWTRMLLVDPVTGAPMKDVIGVFGELNRSAELQRAGFMPLGTTVDSTNVKSITQVHQTLGRISGKQGLDGVWRKETLREIDFLIDESKATADTSPASPTDTTGQLKATKKGKGPIQLSKDYVTDRLDGVGMSDDDLDLIRQALAAKNGIVTVTLPEGREVTVRVRKVYSQSFRDSSGSPHTHFFGVIDDGDIGVKIGREITKWEPINKP